MLGAAAGRAPPRAGAGAGDRLRRRGHHRHGRRLPGGPQRVEVVEIVPAVVGAPLATSLPSTTTCSPTRGSACRSTTGAITCSSPSTPTTSSPATRCTRCSARRPSTRWTSSASVAAGSNRAGSMCQYLPLHRMPADAFRRAVATFQDAFSETWVLFSLGHAVLVGRERPLDLDWRLWSGRLATTASPTTFRLGPGRAGPDRGSPPARPRGVPRGRRRPALHRPPPPPRVPRPGRLPAGALGGQRQRPGGGLPFADRPDPQPAERDGGRAERLVAGKRLLLFAMLERDRGDLDGSLVWLRRALQVAGDDPEVVDFARQVEAESRAPRGTGRG